MLSVFESSIILKPLTSSAIFSTILTINDINWFNLIICNYFLINRNILAPTDDFSLTMHSQHHQRSIWLFIRFLNNNNWIIDKNRKFVPLLWKSSFLRRGRNFQRPFQLKAKFLSVASSRGAPPSKTLPTKSFFRFPPKLSKLNLFINLLLFSIFSALLLKPLRNFLFSISKKR